jgi:hypothetical protein
MSEETIGVLIAVAALGAFFYFTSGSSETPPIGSTPPVGDALSAAVNPAEFNAGPAWFIANQPYYFAPPVGNMMPPATASNTINTNDDGGVSVGCGC